VKLEQASKAQTWTPTRRISGEGSTGGEETETHLSGPPG